VPRVIGDTHIAGAETTSLLSGRPNAGHTPRH
jgi:hypothetical protein